MLEAEMNKRQQIIISIGILLVILSGLFPSYEGEIWREGGNLGKYMGYHFLFLPPNERDVFEAVLKRTPSDTMSDQNQILIACSSHIITSRAWLQIVTIVVATLGLLVLFAEKRNEESSNKPDAGDG
jgi:uncharacterized membrane protein